MKNILFLVLIFGLFYLGFLPSHWLKLRSLIEIDLGSHVTLLPSSWSPSFSFGMIITFFSATLFGWGKTGHRIVGKIAENYLTKNAKTLSTDFFNFRHAPTALSRPAPPEAGRPGRTVTARPIHY